MDAPINSVHIAMVDDEAEFRQTFAKTLENIMGNLDVRYTLDQYESGNSFFERAGAVSYDIIFLDVEMPEQDGFSVAKQIRKAEIDAKLIFLTNYHQWMHYGYDYKAYHYLTKDLELPRLTEVILGAIHEITSFQSIHIFDIDTNAVYFVKGNAVLYIEANGHYSTVVTAERKYFTKKNMKYWESTLDNKFIRCHKSYIINISQIKKIEGSQIYVADSVLPVSTRRLPVLKKKFHDYIKINARIL